MTLALAAFKSYTVGKALKVDYNGVAVLRGAVLDRYHSGVSFRHCVNFRLNLFRGYLNGGFFCLQAFILADFNFGIGCNRNLEIHAVFLGNGNHFKIHFVVNNLKTRVLNSVLNKVVIEKIESVLKENLGAVVLLNKMKRRFTLSETGHIYFLAVSFVSLRDSLAELFTVDGDFKLMPIGINLFCFF